MKVSTILVVKGEKIELDKEGYLEHLDQWSPEIAHILACNEGLELTESHWEVIDVIREFHSCRGLSPVMRIMVKLMENEFGPEKGNSLYLLSLFPGSPAKLAAKIAGLPRPTNCL
ncbi:MAG: TusE/DsrC/DsvC family sulfur relay protein [Pseudohongiellaceae bacterium]